MSMKGHLLRDFGIDLNIRNCEANGTQGAPFYVLDTAVNEGLKTAVTCIRLISLKLGRSWNLATISSMESSEPAFVKISLNVILLTKDEYITETVNYYFHLQVLPGELTKNFNHPVLGLDKTTGLIIPLSLGWVQFDTHRLNELKGMGTTYEFSSQFLKASIYVYDDGHVDIGTGVSARLSEEFEVAITQIQEVYTDYQLWGSPSKEDTFLCQYFCSKTTLSILAMTAIDGQFVKFRLTGPIYPELKEAIKSTLVAFQHLAMLAISNR